MQIIFSVDILNLTQWVSNQKNFHQKRWVVLKNSKKSRLEVISAIFCLNLILFNKHCHLLGFDLSFLISQEPSLLCGSKIVRWRSVIMPALPIYAWSLLRARPSNLVYDPPPRSSKRNRPLSPTRKCWRTFEPRAPNPAPHLSKAETSKRSSRK